MMNLQHFKFLPWAFLPLLSACVKTEIIPEILESKLSLTKAAVSLPAGESIQLNASYTDESGVNHPNLIQWQSRIPAVATVTAAGYVDAHSAGQTWAIASAPGNLRDSVLITVTDDNNDIAAIVILNAPATLVAGESAVLKAGAYNAANQEISSVSFTWAGSDPAALSVAPNGQITALSPGNVLVTATADGISSFPAAIEVVSAGDTSRSGIFSGNMGYSVKGTATLQQSGLNLTLQLGGDFAASNGPMLGVYLAKTASGGLNAQNSLQLALLSANAGAQEYSVPAGTWLHDYDYVVIYCIPFNVRFGTAKLNG